MKHDGQPIDGKCFSYAGVDNRLTFVGKKKKRKPRQAKIVDKMNGTEYMIFGVLFALFPCANVMATGVLYIFWQETHPNKAYQLNQLCWIIFAAQVLLSVCLGSIACIIGANR